MATDDRIRQARTTLFLNSEYLDAYETYEDAPSSETYSEMRTRSEILHGYMNIVRIGSIDEADAILNGVAE